MSAREAGFTLLEILVALVVFGFLLIGLTQGVHFGFRLWNSQSAMIAQRGNLSAVDSTLRGLIGGMDPGYSIDPPNIVGLPQAFAFTTELPAGAADGDERHADVSLSLDGRHEFILRWTPHLHADRLGGAPDIQSTILLYNVANVAFRYWRPTGAVGWVRQWDERAPPGLVAIKITFLTSAAAAKPPEWPEIVVAPMRQRAD